ncbi:3990_t:CDS:2 [Acaulospora morrowiae]|uniref:3990_t:CDS:1 n=1 Tax=Acaulospora morrowiae TaxID=94023 RepID=A0A9N8VUU3_9GLOM|nr:3990_t:CDS:2 [Acaulospora morrowiae]
MDPKNYERDSKNSSELLPNSMPSENTNMEKKTDQPNRLYYEIDVARKKGDQENWKAIQSYLRFKEALSIYLALLLKKTLPMI